MESALPYCPKHFTPSPSPTPSPHTYSSQQRPLNHHHNHHNIISTSTQTYLLIHTIIQNTIYQSKYPIKFEERNIYHQKNSHRHPLSSPEVSGISLYTPKKKKHEKARKKKNLLTVINSQNPKSMLHRDIPHHNFQYIHNKFPHP